MPPGHLHPHILFIPVLLLFRVLIVFNIHYLGSYSLSLMCTFQQTAGPPFLINYSLISSHYSGSAGAGDIPRHVSGFIFLNSLNNSKY